MLAEETFDQQFGISTAHSVVLSATAFFISSVTNRIVPGQEVALRAHCPLSVQALSWQHARWQWRQM